MKKGKILPFRSRADMSETMDKTTRWNFASFVLDGSCFSIGSAFLEPNTLLPALISSLTNNSVIIGLSSTIRNAGYLLPQLFVAGYAERLPYKKPFLRVNGWVNRLSVLLMALVAYFWAGRKPDLALAGLLFCISLFALTDGIGGVPWTDLLAKSMPATKRGRLLATMQFIGGMGAFLVGFLIRQVLAVVDFPLNYTILFLLGFCFLALSLIGTMLVREQEGVVRSRSSWREYMRRLPLIWRSNPLFQQMIFTRMMLSFFYLPLPFYVVFAQEKLGFPDSAVGIFISAQMAGNIIFGLLWGNLGDKRGNRLVICLVTLITLLTPVCALLASWLAHEYANLAFMLYLLVFLAIGATLGGVWIGFTNYLLEVADAINRPTYVGMMNTLIAPFTFLPIIGGVLLRFMSHELLFAIASIFILSSVILAFRLPEPRSRQQQGQQRQVGHSD